MEREECFSLHNVLYITSLLVLDGRHFYNFGIQKIHFFHRQREQIPGGVTAPRAGVPDELFDVSIPLTTFEVRPTLRQINPNRLFHIRIVAFLAHGGGNSTALGGGGQVSFFFTHNPLSFEKKITRSYITKIMRQNFIFGKNSFVPTVTYFEFLKLCFPQYNRPH